MTGLPADITQIRLLTSEEVAQRFGTTKSTVRQWSADGRLSPLRTPGKHLRFLESEIEQVLAEMTSERGEPSK
jgi:excisionase family DNA binding protein